MASKSAQITQIAQAAKKAAPALSLLSGEAKARALRAMAKAILKHKKQILSANAKDVAAAEARGMASSLVGRLRLTDAKIQGISDSLLSIAKLPDPVGRLLWERKRPNGLRIKKVSVPIGVILIIYESRPNVTADCMALCLKSGNSVILKGGSEALYSNQAIFSVLEKSALLAGVPKGAFQLVGVSGREAVKQLLNESALIDLVIPRGGEGLIREVAATSKIPVIKHYKGVCHVYIDKDADLKKALKIVINAKTQNPGVCNALETLLVHQAAAKKFLPLIADALAEKKVKVRGSAEARKIVSFWEPATEEDWSAEYLDLILSVKVVAGLEAAMSHIQKYGSQHSDAIVTENKKAAQIFTEAVDSACVFVNASTRFNDGGEFGMGAEMGISTDKLHARGPMGLEELTSYKYVVLGNGQIRG